MEVITGNLSSEPVTSQDRGAGANTLISLIDDLHICGRDVAIDGPGKTLGNAGA
jgi:hypothetical protein